MRKLLVVGNFNDDKQVEYAKYISSKYSPINNVLISGNNSENLNMGDNIQTCLRTDDLYVNYVFSADIVFILDEEINYFKYKNNQRVIFFDKNVNSSNNNGKRSFENKYNRYKYITDNIVFSSLKANAYQELDINFIEYHESFESANIQEVIDNIDINFNATKLANEILVISNSPYLNLYSRNNLQRFIEKIVNSYEYYNIILLNINISENNNFADLYNSYSTVLNINNNNIIKYLKHFEGIIIYDDNNTLTEYIEKLEFNNIEDLSNRKIKEDLLKLFFCEENLDGYLKKLDNEEKLMTYEYVDALNSQYDSSIQNKKISVVICRYNTPLDLLYRAINSVFDSDHKNIEVILVDDGSVDNIEENINSEFKNKDIKYIYQENQGPGPARNTGISSASGEYICFLDSDDTLIKAGLKLMLIHSEIFNLDLVIGRRFICDENGMYVGNSFDNLFTTTYAVYYNQVPNKVYEDNMPVNKLIRRKLFYDKNLWFESGLYEDAIFTALLFSNTEEYHCINIPIYSWYKYGEETTISSGRGFDNFNQRINAYQKTWDILIQVDREKLLLNNMYAFTLYIESLSSYNNLEQQSFFNQARNYIIERLKYYSEINAPVITTTFVRYLINNDFSGFLKFSEEYTKAYAYSDIIMDNYICHTHFHIYNAIIRTVDSKRPSRLYVMKDYQKIDDKFLDKINDLNIFENVISFSNGNIVGELNQSLINYPNNEKMIIESMLYQKFKYLFSECNRKDKVFIFSDDLPHWFFVSKYFNEIYRIEDAYNSFKREVEIRWEFGIWGAFLQKYRGNIYPETHGLSDKVENILVSEQIEDIPKEYKDKLIISNIKDITNEHQDELKDIFSYIYDINNVMDENTILILTQPLGNYYCTRAEQIKLYEKIASKYDRKNVLIKPHPADNVDYRKYGFKVLSKNAPIEVYNLTSKKIKKAITFGSSSIYLIDFAKEKEILFKMDDFTIEDVNVAIKEIIGKEKVLNVRRVKNKLKRTLKGKRNK